MIIFCLQFSNGPRKVENPRNLWLIKFRIQSLNDIELIAAKVTCSLNLLLILS